MSIKRLITVAMLGSVLVIGGAVPGYAHDHRDKCEQRIRKAEENLRKVERKHGEHSRQAEKKRQELEQERANVVMTTLKGSTKHLE